MKLKEFVDALHKYLERQKPYDEDAEVVIPTANPSVGPSAVSQVLNGFDWNKGRLFIIPSNSLYYALKVTIDEIRTTADKMLGYYTSISELPYKKKDCYTEGFIQGAKWGMTKLLKDNDIK